MKREEHREEGLKALDQCEYMVLAMAHPSVCLTAVGEQHVIQAEYTTHFTSAVVRGRAVEVTDPSEIRQGLRAICDKYTPDCPGRVEEVIEKYLPAVSVWRVDLTSVSGRRKEDG